AGGGGPFGRPPPLVPAAAAPVDAELALGRVVLGVALDRDDVDRVRLVRVDVDREAEVTREVAADLLPRLSRIVAPHDVPVLLHEEHARTRPVHGDAMDAVADLGGRVRDLLRAEAAVDRTPRRTAVVAPERARGRDRDEEPAGDGGRGGDRVQGQAAAPRGARAGRAGWPRGR